MRKLTSMASSRLSPTRTKITQQYMAEGDTVRARLLGPPVATASTTTTTLTDHGQLGLGGGQQVLQDEQQDGDGQQHRHLEAQLLAARLVDEEGRHVQQHEVEQRHDEDDHVEHRLPGDGDLKPGGEQVEDERTGGGEALPQGRHHPAARGHADHRAVGDAPRVRGTGNKEKFS
ncbi:hypothetical protein EYF80_057667 [Liparis tanakae]|uniref:Uncharacterized protein n=1 Tax=Liparis tanakae TaxID=230148 RepID=A0A4Z2EV97_9TELE|nr:hypothetical protein EYF80_057667 [Liparis tanakae]